MSLRRFLLERGIDEDIVRKMEEEKLQSVCNENIKINACTNKIKVQLFEMINYHDDRKAFNEYKRHNF